MTRLLGLALLGLLVFVAAGLDDRHAASENDLRCDAVLRDEAAKRDAWIVAGRTRRTEVAFVSALALAQDVCTDAR